MREYISERICLGRAKWKRAGFVNEKVEAEVVASEGKCQKMAWEGRLDLFQHYSSAVNSLISLLQIPPTHCHLVIYLLIYRTYIKLR